MCMDTSNFTIYGLRHLELIRYILDFRLGFLKKCHTCHICTEAFYTVHPSQPLPSIWLAALLTHLFFQKPTDGEIGLHFLFRSFNLRMRHDGRRQRLVRMGNGVAHLCVPRGWNKWESPLCMCVVLWRYQTQHRDAREEEQSRYMTTGFFHIVSIPVIWPFLC